MRRYTNKKGERITVNKAHLETAVKIKEELQKSSHNRKCSWSLLVKLMKKEGFNDAENSENYRCLIKNYQKSIGRLPNQKKYAEMVSDGKLESIKELIGELSIEKRDAQNTFRELSKVKREVIDFTLLTENISEIFKSYDFSKVDFKYKPVKNSGGAKMIVVLSDLHIGALVDIKYNKYNFEIAQERLQIYLNNIIDKCKDKRISDVYVINLGDVIEHATMRHAQGFNVEFDYGEQIVRASDLIIKFLIGLSDNHLNVTYSGIAGNHDRFEGDKNKNIRGSHAVKPINRAIESAIENLKRNNIKYIQADDYKHSFTINGKNVLALHGDLDGKNNQNLIAKHTALDGIDYDIVLMGHYHTREVVELSGGKFLFISASLKGSDEYSIDTLRKMSMPSQSYYIVNKDKTVEVNWVEFN